MKSPDRSTLPDSQFISECADWQIDLQQNLTEKGDVRALFKVDGRHDFPDHHTQLYSPYDRWRLNRIIKQCIRFARTNDGESSESRHYHKTIIIPVRSTRSPLTLVEESVSPQFSESGAIIGCNCKVVNISGRGGNGSKLASVSNQSSELEPAIQKANYDQFRITLANPERTFHLIKHHSFIPSWCLTKPESNVAAQPNQSHSLSEKASSSELAQLLEEVSEGVSATDRNGEQYFVNRAFTEFTQTVDKASPEQRLELEIRLSNLARIAESSGTAQFEEIKVTREDKVTRYLVCKSPINSRGGITTTVKLAGAILPNHDHREIGARDRLTGLLNKQGLLQALTPFYETARADDQPTFAVIRIRLDTSTIDGTTTEENIQSQFLCLAAAKIDSSIRPGDICGRWSDNEIVVGISHISLVNVEIIAARIAHSLRTINLLQNNLPVRLSFHLSLALKNAKKDSLECLIADSSDIQSINDHNLGKINLLATGLVENRRLN